MKKISIYIYIHTMLQYRHFNHNSTCMKMKLIYLIFPMKSYFSFSKNLKIFMFFILFWVITINDQMQSYKIKCLLQILILFRYQTQLMRSVQSQIQYSIGFIIQFYQKFTKTKSVSIESNSIEQILCATIYPNLTELKLNNLNKSIVLQYFIGKEISVCYVIFCCLFI